VAPPAGPPAAPPVGAPAGPPATTATSDTVSKKSNVMLWVVIGLAVVGIVFLGAAAYFGYKLRSGIMGGGSVGSSSA
jgi:hypothetical protein